MPQQLSSRFVFLWDVFVTLLATYAAIEIPYSMVVHMTPPAAVTWANYLVTICFIADIFVRLRRPEHHPGHAHHHTKTNEKRHYPLGWLIVDVLSAIPFGLMTFIASPVLFGVLRLLRLLKILRIVSFRSAWLHGINSNPVLIRMSFFFYFLGLSAHWIACVWLAIHTPEVRVLIAGQPEMINAYVQALYWSVTTITTIGYGDITPDKTHNAEMIFSMCVELIGAGAYGYIIGNIANILTNIDMAKTRHQERVDRMNSFMKSKKIPKHLQEQVYQYYNYLWETRKGYNDATILAELPESFKFEFAMLLNKSIIEKVPLF